MKITITKSVTTKEEVEVEIPAPSFWKKQSPTSDEFAAIYSEEIMVSICLTNLKHGHTNYVRTWLNEDELQEFIEAEQITAEEFNLAKREAIARLRFETEESLSVVTSPEVKYGKPSPALLKIENSLQ